MMEKFITAIRKKNEEASKKIEKAFDKAELEKQLNR